MRETTIEATTGHEWKEEENAASEDGNERKLSSQNHNTVTFYYQGRSRRQENSVEKLTFYNHTECECQDAGNDEMPRDATYQRHTHLSRTNVAEKM
ncbi:hypothetical protein LSTR_LSTR015729 [Laodelphax striatellus]|uniref:Uncharacterized protein n=1 Tax=Laodelphax striatellus TaxID=195883 RepID=A0A482WRM9_LAOST|nr:hypothetical protein LSTR_LSTR015729 [Laodelphax striatellus]